MFMDTFTFKLIYDLGSINEIVWRVYYHIYVRKQNSQNRLSAVQFLRIRNTQRDVQLIIYIYCNTTIGK